MPISVRAHALYVTSMSALISPYIPSRHAAGFAVSFVDPSDAS